MHAGLRAAVGGYELESCDQPTGAVLSEGQVTAAVSDRIAHRERFEQFRGNPDMRTTPSRRRVKRSKRLAGPVGKPPKSRRPFCSKLLKHRHSLTTFLSVFEPSLGDTMKSAGC